MLRGELPTYAPRLAAFHRACAGELRALVAALPIRPGDLVLDVACGDGAYTVWLAERVGGDGRVLGVDLNARYLSLARERARRCDVGHRIELVRGDARALPFDDASFDAVWCAHSLQSLPDPDGVLCEMRRVVRPGGLVAVLENDSLHYLMLPLAPELELAVQEAQLEGARTHRARNLYIGRRLRGVLSRGGLEQTRVKTFSIDHQAPLDRDERAFLGDYLRELGERTREYLDPSSRRALESAITPDSDDYLLDRADFFTTHLEILAWGREPS